MKNEQAMHSIIKENPAHQVSGTANQSTKKILSDIKKFKISYFKIELKNGIIRLEFPIVIVYQTVL